MNPFLATWIAADIIIVIATLGLAGGPQRFAPRRALLFAILQIASFGLAGGSVLSGAAGGPWIWSALALMNLSYLALARNGAPPRRTAVLLGIAATLIGLVFAFLGGLASLPFLAAGTVLLGGSLLLTAGSVRARVSAASDSGATAP